MSLAPVILFVYNRPLTTKKTIEALKKNYLASESELFIFSDGAKNEISSLKVDEIRQYLKNIIGFKSIQIFESTINKGLANSIISGVTKIIEKYGKVIVLEDDLITSPNFLNFVNQALNVYEINPRIFSISGYSLDLPSLKEYTKDYYVGYRASSWGWGTWENRWQNIDWEVKTYNTFKKQPLKKLKFMRGGSDMPRMLSNQMNEKIDSWAIRWCFNQFQRDMLTVFPSKSKLISIGFGENATHTKKTKRFDTTLDKGELMSFNFDNNPKIDQQLMKESRNKFSIKNRFLDKLL